jgi:hypothetical protein
MKKSWSGSMMANYYKLSFKVGKLADVGTKEFTVKVEFTDYMAGRVLKAQKAIK